MEYTWHISKLEVNESIYGLNNIVRKIHYTFVAKENEFSGWIRGVYICPISLNDGFINYNDLKIENIINWLEIGLDINKLKQELIEQIDNQKNLPLVTYDLPWEI
jgi:hypothetical protein